MVKIDMQLYKEIGYILKRQRQIIGISLDQLVDRIGGIKTKSSLKRYEDGQSRIDTEIFPIICHALDLDPMDVIKEAECSVEFALYENIPINSDSPLGDYDENVKHLTNEPRLLKLYENMLDNNNIAILFDKVQKLTPEDLEQVLRIVDTFNEETK